MPGAKLPACGGAAHCPYFRMLTSAYPAKAPIRFSSNHPFRVHRKILFGTTKSVTHISFHPDPLSICATGALSYLYIFSLFCP